MKLKLKNSFNRSFLKQVAYIAQDSPTRALKFQKKILSEVNNILKNPYKNRKSVFFNNKNIRDLIVKGYVIVYQITLQEIIVFGFKKQNQSFK